MNLPIGLMPAQKSAVNEYPWPLRSCWPRPAAFVRLSRFPTTTTGLALIKLIPDILTEPTDKELDHEQTANV